MIPNKTIVPGTFNEKLNLCNKLFSLDLSLLAQSLASRGEFESSLQLLEIVSQLSYSGRALQVAPVVFHHMIKSKQPTSWLLETTVRMAAIGCIDKSTWESVLVYMHKSANSDVILHTIQAMHQQVC